MWNDEFELPESSYSVSDIQDYIDYIIRKHETLLPCNIIPFIILLFIFTSTGLTI